MNNDYVVGLSIIEHALVTTLVAEDLERLESIIARCDDLPGFQSLEFFERDAKRCRELLGKLRALRWQPHA